MSIFIVTKDNWKDDIQETFLAAPTIEDALKKVKGLYGRKGGKTDVGSGYVIFEEGHKEGECLLTATEIEMMSSFPIKNVMAKSFPDFIKASLEDKGIDMTVETNKIGDAAYSIEIPDHPRRKEVISLIEKAAKTYDIKLTGSIENGMTQAASPSP